jgi:hypothetical protein
MRRFLHFTLIIWWMFAPGFRVFAQSEDSPGVEISAPAPGTPLQGLVTIVGSTVAQGFQSWEVNFSYNQDITGTWFLIAEGDSQITRGELTQWDTTMITDGDYNLRLTVYRDDGQREHFIVNDLRVRNYSPIETITPTPTLTPTPFTVTPRPSLTPTATQPPSETPLPDTPTPLPTNPVTITQSNITNSILRGAAGTAAAFLLVGLYISIKKMIRK